MPTICATARPSAPGSNGTAAAGARTSRAACSRMPGGCAATNRPRRSHNPERENGGEDRQPRRQRQDGGRHRQPGARRRPSCHRARRLGRRSVGAEHAGRHRRPAHRAGAPARPGGAVLEDDGGRTRRQASVRAGSGFSIRSPPAIRTCSASCAASPATASPARPASMRCSSSTAPAPTARARSSTR